MQYAEAYSTVRYPFPQEEPPVMAELMARDKEGREGQWLQQGHHKLFFKLYLCCILLVGKTVFTRGMTRVPKLSGKLFWKEVETHVEILVYQALDNIGVTYKNDLKG